VLTTPRRRLFTIGEFSKVTGLPVKTLRFYHEKGLLTPAHVDAQTGYRYYGGRQVEKARIVTCLRGLEFSLEQVAEILASHDDEADILDFLERQRRLLEEKVGRYQAVLGSLTKVISNEREARRAMQNSSFEVEEKTLDTLLVAGVRMRGKYGESGKGFGVIGQAMGRHVSGNPLLLHYDAEYREEDADFEACMPVRKAKAAQGVSVRELPGGRCVSLLHQGPYEELGRSYARVLEYVKEKGYEVVLPTREVYLKGPGMIFKGNPKNYLTEIQMLIKGG
jgi:DNA-binding transcriptional MerR regulator/effector-binding domain-containing protein